MSELLPVPEPSKFSGLLAYVGGTILRWAQVAEGTDGTEETHQTSALRVFAGKLTLHAIIAPSAETVSSTNIDPAAAYSLEVGLASSENALTGWCTLRHTQGGRFIHAAGIALEAVIFQITDMPNQNIVSSLAEQISIQINGGGKSRDAVIYPDSLGGLYGQGSSLSEAEIREVVSAIDEHVPPQPPKSPPQTVPIAP